MPWNDYPFDSLTVPSSATGSDPRVYIGDEDPILDTFGTNVAGIVWYASSGTGLAMTVVNDAAIGDPPYLQMSWLVDSLDTVSGTVHQLGGFDYDTAANTVGAAFGDPGSNATTRICATNIYGTSIDVRPYDGGGTVGSGGTLQLGGPNPGSSPIDRSDVKIYGNSLTRGKRIGAFAASNSAAVAAVETVMLTTANARFYAGRAYDIHLRAGVQTSVAGANATAFIRFRATGLAGQDLGELYRFPMPTTALPYSTQGSRVFTVGAADVVDVVVCTMVFTGGATGVMFATAASPRVMEITDIGEAADYPSAPVLV